MKKEKIPLKINNRKELKEYEKLEQELINKVVKRINEDTRLKDFKGVLKEEIKPHNINGLNQARIIAKIIKRI